MVMKKILSVFLIVVFLATSIYFIMPDKVKIDIQKTRTQYSVWENEEWILAATEYVNLYEGSTKMRAKSRDLIYYEDNDFAYVERESKWKDNITTTQIYTFFKKADRVEEFPIKNEFRCYNCKGKIVHYEVRDILYDGETKEITSPFSFGHKMEMEWEDGAYYSKVFQQIVTDKIIVKYNPTSDYESYDVRLFDPTWWNEDWNYKKQINITTQIRELANYSVNISVTYDSDMNANFSDIRFLDSTETVELAYFNWTQSNGNKADFYVHIANITNNTDTSIYMYYGNPAVESTANRSNTFMFFDDFNTDTESQWWQDGCNANAFIMGGGWLKYTGEGYEDYCELGSGSYWNTSNDYGFEMMGRYNLTSMGTQIKPVGDMRDSSVRVRNIWTGGQVYGTSANRQDCLPSFSGDCDTSAPVSNGNIYTDITRLYNNGQNKGNWSSWANWTQHKTYSGIDLSENKSAIDNFQWTWSHEHSSILNLDWIQIRGYVNPEPAVTFGGEENVYGLNVILSSPIDRFNTTDNMINLSCNFTGKGSIEVYNISLFVYNLSNNLSYYNSEDLGGVVSYNKTWTTTPLIDGEYKWSCLGNGSEGYTIFTENRTFILETIPPLINIVSPNELNYSENIFQLNYTIDEGQSCWWSNNSGIWNSTDVIAGINFTGLESNEGYNTWEVYCNDSFGNEENDSIKFFKDTTPPEINFTNPTSYNSVCGNREILINITSNDSTSGVYNIIIYLYNSSGFVNSSTFVNPISESIYPISYYVNFSDLLDGTYSFNSSTENFNNNSNNTEIISGVIIGCMNLTVDGIGENILSELGGNNLELVASYPEQDICVDINNHNYGVNFLCGNNLLNFNFSLDYFRKTTFNDSSSSETLEYLSNDTKYVYVNAHQYDEVDNLSFNISGIGIENLQINKTNSSEIDRIFPGWLFNNLIYLNKTIEGYGNVSISYNNPGSVLVNFFMDDNAKLNYFIFNASGIKIGVNFIDNFYNFNYIDKTKTTAQLDLSGAILTANSSLQEFIFDDFEDDVINNIWEYTNGSGSLGGSSWSQVVDETGGKVSLSTSISNPSGDIGSGTFPIVFATNYSSFNLYTSESILLNIDSSYSSDADNVGCEGNAFGYLGQEIFWTSYYEQDPDVDQSQVESSFANVTFFLEKYNQTTWMINITGIETSSIYDSDGCGTVSGTYNWTNGTFYISKESCSDINGTLDNYFLFNASYNDSNALAIVTSAVIEQSTCESITLTTNIYNINNSLWDRENSTVISTPVYESSGNIDKATLTVNGYTAINESIFLYLSADDGLNWESVQNNVEHVFVNAGTSLRWRVDFVLNTSAYLNSTSFLTRINITVPGDYPSNLSFDFGNDGIIDFNFTGELNETTGPIIVNVSNANLTNALNSSPILYDHLISVPLVVSSDSLGGIILSEFNLTYNPNPISLGIDSILDYLINMIGFITLPINFYSDSIGNLTIDDLRYDYAGGNDTIEILVHDTNYTINLSRNITYFYSRWDYDFGPPNVEWIYFAPTNPNAKNVTPYGQTDEYHMLNITNYGYGGRNANLSVYQNGSLSCVNTTLSLTNNKSQGIIINESWINLKNLSYLDTVDIWLWADYSCNYSTWTLFEPQYYFRQCVEGGSCSIDII